MSRCTNGQHWFLAIGTPEDGQACDCGEQKHDLSATLSLRDTIALLQEVGLDPIYRMKETEAPSDAC